MKRKKKLFITSLILLPVLFQYSTGIKGFTFGDLFFVLSLIPFLISNNKTIKKQKSIYIVILFVLLQTFVFYFAGTLNSITTALRYIVYLLGIVYFSSLKECRNYAFKVLEIVSISLATLFFVQYFALHVMGMAFPGVLTFLPMTDESLYDYSNVVFVYNNGRCMSAFAEPSHFAIYILLYLGVKLFERPVLSAHALFICAFISLSLILCSSFTGVAGMAFLWIFRFLFFLRSGGKTIWVLLIIAPILVAGAIYAFNNTDAGAYIFNQDVMDRQSGQRFSGFAYIELMSGTSRLIGSGMIEMGEEVYLSGWPRLYYYYGIIGAILYVVSFLLTSKWKSLSMILLLLIAILMIGTEMNFASFIMPFMLMVALTKDGYFFFVDSQKQRR